MANWIPSLFRIAALGLTMSVGAHAALAASPAWFGQALPPPVNDPAVPVVDTLNVDLPALLAKFGPGPTSPLLAGDKIKDDLKTIIGFSLKSKASGDFLWGRVSGTPAYYDTVTWAANAMKAGGVKDAHVEDFTASLTIPTAGELRIVGDASYGEGTRDIVLQSMMVGGRGPVNGTVTAPMIYVGHATLADMIGRDVKGKIAVLHTTLNPGMYSADEIGRPALLVKAGAVGVIEILDQVGNMQAFDADRHGCGTGFCFTIGGADGFFLENMLGKAAGAGKVVSARMSSTAKEQTGLKTANAVGTIPGKTNRTIIINAHADAWFVGGDDNGGGLAVAVALARYFAAQPQPDHTLVFLISAGHHTAGIGIPDFRLKHEKEYVTNADFIINLEHVANTGMVRSLTTTHDNNFGRPMVSTSTEWPKAVAVSNRAPFLIDVWRKGVSCFGLALQRVVDNNPPGEMGSFLNIQRMGSILNPAAAESYKALPNITNVPITQMISVGPLYHATGEGVDSVPAEGLERAARFHAYMIQAADKAAPDLLKGAAYTPSAGCPATP